MLFYMGLSIRLTDIIEVIRYLSNERQIYEQDLSERFCRNFSKVFAGLFLWFGKGTNRQSSKYHGYPLLND